MATSQTIGQRFAQFRNFVLEMVGRACEFGTVAATGNGTTAGAATLSTNMGIVTTEALTTAGNGATKYTLTLTNTKAAVGDMVQATLGFGTNTAGTPILQTTTVTANTITFIVLNQHASAALNGTLVVNYELVKKLSTITPNF